MERSVLLANAGDAEAGTTNFICSACSQLIYNLKRAFLSEISPTAFACPPRLFLKITAWVFAGSCLVGCKSPWKLHGYSLRKWLLYWRRLDEMAFSIKCEKNDCQWISVIGWVVCTLKKEKCNERAFNERNLFIRSWGKRWGLYFNINAENFYCIIIIHCQWDLAKSKTWSVLLSNIYRTAHLQLSVYVTDVISRELSTI